jgi:hypothetical protein
MTSPKRTLATVGSGSRAGRRRHCGRHRQPGGTSRYWHIELDRPIPDGGECSVVRLYFAPRKSTSVVSIVPAFRPGAVCDAQYRFVCAMTISGGGAPKVV